MKKLLVFSVLLLSGCVSVTDLTKYPHYDVQEPTEKARMYISSGTAAESKPVKKMMRQYFLTASSKQEADFIVKSENFQINGNGIGAFFLSGMTLWILPTWSTNENSYPFSLMEVSTGKTIRLSDIRVKEREYYGWLLLPLVFAADTYFMISNAYDFALASAIEEAASLIYNPNSRLYQKEKKWSAPNTSVREKPVEKPQGKASAPVPSPVSAPAPATPEDLDMLW